MSETLYKFLNGREATHVPGYRYRLGQWREVQGDLIPCENGLHLLKPAHLSRWIGRDLFVAEFDSEMARLDEPDKVVVRRARIVEHLRGWNERTARLAAADFAEAVLPIFEKHMPGDDRPRLAIQATRDYANGLVGATAGAAARAAAWAAAWAAARAAAWDPAWSGDAAGDAARAAERRWQTKRLFDYIEGRRGTVPHTRQEKAE